jgi:hypothetical protein
MDPSARSCTACALRLAENAMLSLTAEWSMVNVAMRLGEMVVRQLLWKLGIHDSVSRC